MALITYRNVGIRAINAVVPKTKRYTSDLSGVIPAELIEKAIHSIGIEERRVADAAVCSSDMCYTAASSLLQELGYGADSIDVLIFLSQTPDYIVPPTSTILQHRLGLSKDTACFDINLACSGYIYGLSVAFAMASQIGVNRVLLLTGETLSKIISSEDKATAPLFGDGAAATLIEKNEEYGTSYFSLNSDGSGDWVLKIPAGAFRNPSSSETLIKKTYEDGSIRNDHQLFMDGIEVFNFTVQEVPADIKRILLASGMALSEIDYFLFHQSNKFMIDFFAKKLKIPHDRVPSSLSKFGNTSSVSIPLTIVTEMGSVFCSRDITAILCGYGAGLSWGTALIEFKNCRISELIEV